MAGARSTSQDVVVMQQLHRPDGSAPRRSIRSRRNDRLGHRGQGIVEYGLLLALVAVVAISALLVLGGGLSGALFDAGRHLDPAAASSKPSAGPTVKPTKTPKPTKKPKPTKPPRMPKP